MSVQPSGMCGCAAGVGGPCSATTSFRGSAARATRLALLLTDLRCFIIHLLVKLFQVLRIFHRQLGVNFETGIGPSAYPFAVMQIRMSGLAITRVRLVVAASGAKRPRPALAAVRLLIDVMLLKKPDLHQPIASLPHG